MTKLPEAYIPIQPTKLQPTVLDNDQDIDEYHLDGGIIPDENGNVLVFTGRQHELVPLKGLYRLQSVLENGTAPGPGRLVTAEQFKKDFTVFAGPYYEYGVKFQPRRDDVVVHGPLEAAIGALDALPALKDSDEYGIVRRLVHEPGDWEPVEQPST